MHKFSLAWTWCFRIRSILGRLGVSLQFSSLSRRADASLSTCSAGFSLIEVLVALAILGLGLALLDGAVSDSLARLERSRREDHAAILADAILARLGQDVAMRPGDQHGRDGLLAWSVHIIPVFPTDPQFPLDRVDLAISDAAGHQIGHWSDLQIAPSAGAHP